MKWPSTTPFWTWPASGAQPWAWPPGKASSVFPTDPLMIDYWHADKGITLSGATGVASWQGQIAGILCTFNNLRPVYGPDGSYFNGRNSVQCSATPVSDLYASGLPPYVGLGARIFIISVFRFRTAPPDTQAIFSYAQQSANDLLMQRSNGAANRFEIAASLPTIIVPVKTPLDALPHSWESWADGTNINNRFDRVLTQQAYTGAGGNVPNAVSIGGAGGNPNVFAANATLVLHGLYSAKPPDAHLISLRDYIQSYWGIAA